MSAGSIQPESNSSDNSCPAERGQPLALDVLDVNQRARALYQRLGFTEVSRRGENNRKIRMRATP